MLLDQPLFMINVLADRSPAIVRLSGELDADSAGELQAEGHCLISAGHRHLTIDCRHLLFCDSHGLNTITELWQQVQPDGSVTVAEPSDHLIKVLEITGLAEMLGVPGDQP